MEKLDTEKVIDQPDATREQEWEILRGGVESVREAIFEVVPDGRDFDFNFEENGSGVSIVLQREDAGGTRDLKEFLPAGFSFKKDDSFRCDLANKAVLFPEAGAKFRAFPLALFHEIGHAQYKHERVLSARQNESRYYQLVSIVLSELKSQYVNMDPVMIGDVISDVLPRWYLDATSKMDAESERNAWAFALKSLRSLERDGYRVFAGFNRVGEIKAVIGYCLATYDFDLFAKRMRLGVDTHKAINDKMFYKSRQSISDLLNNRREGEDDLENQQ